MFLSLFGPKRPTAADAFRDTEVAIFAPETRPVGFDFAVASAPFKIEQPPPPYIGILSPGRGGSDTLTSRDRVLAFPTDIERSLLVPLEDVKASPVRFAIREPICRVASDLGLRTSCSSAFPQGLANDFIAPETTSLPILDLTCAVRPSLPLDISPPTTKDVDVAIPPPTVKGKVFVRFIPSPIGEAAERARDEATRIRPPDDDPFSALFFILLAKHNWDVRVQGLDSLLAAYPPGKRPFAFQHEGLAFLFERNRALLADEMGLGKTIQAILAMRACIHGGDVRRVLVVCPKSLLANWYQEISVWAPELSVTVVHGENKYAAIHRSHHVYITNFDSVERVVLGRGGWSDKKVKPFDLLIVDEIQNLKNPSAKKSKAVAEVPAIRRWALTGTPLENAFSDYRSVWKVIDPQLARRPLNDNQLLAATKANVLRREKASVMRDLPEKIVEVQFVELEGKQRQRYFELERQVKADIGSRLAGREDEKLRMHIFALLNKLKQFCVVDPQSRESAKMDWIEERLEEMHPDGVLRNHCEKALVFTQYPNLVWDEWKLQDRIKGYKPARYDGSLRDEHRLAFPERFQTDVTVHTPASEGAG